MKHSDRQLLMLLKPHITVLLPRTQLDLAEKPPAKESPPAVVALAAFLCFAFAMCCYRWDFAIFTPYLPSLPFLLSHFLFCSCLFSHYIFSYIKWIVKTKVLSYLVKVVTPILSHSLSPCKLFLPTVNRCFIFVYFFRRRTPSNFLDINKKAKKRKERRLPTTNNSETNSFSRASLDNIESRVISFGKLPSYK